MKDAWIINIIRVNIEITTVKKKINKIFVNFIGNSIS